MRALLIGINQYKTIQSLSGCINDVVNVRDTLVSTAGLKVSDIQMLQDADATTANIRKGLGDLGAGAVQGQRLWIHFSGHGSQLLNTDPSEPDGLDEVLCPHDYDGQPSNAIRDDDLIQCLTAIPATSDLIVTLDCCHSGDYSRGGPAVRTPHRVPTAVANARRSGVSRYHSIRTAGLSSNCLVVSACQPSQLAYETNSPQGPAGAFTTAFFAQVNASPRESVRRAVEVATIALSSAAPPQTPVMEGSDRLRDDSYVLASRGLGRNVLRPRGGQIIWSEEWGFNAAGSGGTVGARVTLIDGNFWLECFVSMFGARPTMSVPLGGDVNESFAIAFGFSLILGVSNFSLGQGQLSFRLKIAVKTPIPFIPPVTVVDSPISIPLSGLTRSTASIGSLADLLAFQALQEPKPPAGPREGPRGEAKLQIVLGPTDDEGTVYVDGNPVVATRINEVKQAIVFLGDGIHSVRTTLKNSGGWGWRNTVRLYVNDRLVTTFDREGGSGAYAGFISEAEANWDLYIKDGRYQNLQGGG